MSLRACLGISGAFLLVAAVAGCNGGPLPADGPPADFMFRYTYEQIEKPEPAEPAGEAVAEPGAAEPGAAEPGAAETGAANPEAKAAPEFPKPTLLRITLVVGGFVTYEAHHSSASSDVKTAEFRIDQEAQDRIYNALREADIYGMEPAYEGPDKWRGRETFEVVSLQSAKEVIVEGTAVDALVDLRNILLDSLPAEEMVKPPMPDRKIVVMDTRTRVFYRSTNPKSRDIPIEFRKEFPDPWKALNSGGKPSPEFGPIPETWD